MRLRSILLPVMALCLFTACQKAYTPDGLVPGSNPSGTMKLVKMGGKTRGSTEASYVSFDYDASGKVIRLTRVETDSSSTSVTIVYRYQRDAAGRVVKIVTNALSAGTPGAGLPDSISINVHYPNSTSSEFDYSTYRFTFSSIDFSDSTRYMYAGGTVTDVYTYQSIAATPMSLTARTQYAYQDNNIPVIKVYSPQTAGAAPSLIATYNLEFDTRNQGLSIGNDAFLTGLDPSYYCRNNLVKTTVVDNTGSGQNLTITGSYQYNSAGYPVSGTQTQSSNNKIIDLSFTYQ